MADSESKVEPVLVRLDVALDHLMEASGLVEAEGWSRTFLEDYRQALQSRLLADTLSRDAQDMGMYDDPVNPLIKGDQS